MRETLRGKPLPGFPYGKVSNPEVHKYRAGIAYIGYKGYRVGWNSEGIRHRIQNRFAHTVKEQDWFRVLSNAYAGFYGGSVSPSRYHNW